MEFNNLKDALTILASGADDIKSLSSQDQQEINRLAKKVLAKYISYDNDKADQNERFSFSQLNISNIVGDHEEAEGIEKVDFQMNVFSSIYFSSRDKMGIIEVRGDEYIYVSGNWALYDFFKEKQIPLTEYLNANVVYHAEKVLNLTEDKVSSLLADLNKVVKTNTSVIGKSKKLLVKGEPIYTETTYFPILNRKGDVSHLLWYSHDTTDSFLEKLKLEEHDHFLSEAQQISKIGNWNLDLIGGKLSWSDEVYRIFGLAPQEFNATYDAFLEFVHPEDRKAVNDIYLSSLENKTPYEISHRLLLQNGDIKHVVEKGVSFYDQDGKAIRSIGTVQDVTAESIALNKIKRLSAIAENTSYSVVITNPKGEVEWVNKAFEKTTGYSLEKINGSTLEFLQGKGTSEAEIQKMHIALEKEEVCSGEILNYKSNGTPFWFEYEIVPIFDEFGRLLNFISTQIDITEKKEFRQRLLESEKKYKALYRKSMVGMLTLDMTTMKVVSVNQTAVKMFGYSNQQQLKASYSEGKHYVNEKDKDEMHQKLFENGEIKNKEIQYQKNNGSSFWAQISARIDHVYQTIECVIIDISEKRSVQTKLQESNNKLKFLTESAVDAIIVINEKQEVELWNNGAEKLFQYTKKEMLGNPISPIIPINYQRHHNSARIKSKADGTQIIGQYRELEGQRKDGEIFPIEINVASWKEDGLMYSSAIIRDVTDRKKQENELKKSLVEKEILLKEVHHRVKNNLQIISGLLEMQSYRTDNLQVKSELRESRSRIKSISIIHEQLYQSTDVSKVELKLYVESLFSEIYNALSDDQRQIQFHILIKNVFVDVNKAIPIGLILNELVTNAVKHAFIDREEGNSIFIDMNEEDDFLKINFWDNGVGFTEPVEELLKKSLGMKVIKALVGQLDGEYEVESDEKGTQFIIKFPIDE